jgi:hypothetical protein
MKTGGDFVLCFLHGYHYAQIAHFFRSLEAVAPSARPVVFAQFLPEETLHELRRRGALLVDARPGRTRGMRNSWERFWPVARMIGQVLPTRDMRARFAFAFVEPLVRRYLLYREWLHRNHEVRKALLADVRDAIFQSDPFTLLGPGEDCVFFEESGEVGSCAINHGWIDHMFGEDAWRPFGERKIICAGTILGTRAGLLRFLDAFVDGVMRARRFDPVFHGGFDQGIVNFVVRSGSVEDSSVRRNGEGIWTGRTDGDTARIDRCGRVVLRDGSPVAVVHQFDRDPGLSERVGHSGANCAIR